MLLLFFVLFCFFTPQAATSITVFMHLMKKPSCSVLLFLFRQLKRRKPVQVRSCGEIDRWRTMGPPFHLFCQNSAQFNSTSGRFKAKEDGFYLISANVLIQRSGLSRINMNILLDGQSSKVPLNTFQPKLSNSPNGMLSSAL